MRSYLEDNERLKEEEKRRQEHEDEEILRYSIQLGGLIRFTMA